MELFVTKSLGENWEPGAQSVCTALLPRELPTGPTGEESLIPAVPPALWRWEVDRSSQCPHWATKPRNSIAVQASFSDVIGDVIRQAGVADTAGTTLPFQDGCVLTAQSGASEWPAIYLSFLWRESPKCFVAVLMHNSVLNVPEGKKGTVVLIAVLTEVSCFSTFVETVRFLLEELLQILPPPAGFC